MSGWKENITEKVWIDVYPDGSLNIIDDGENYEMDRQRVGLSKDEMDALIKRYYFMLESNKRDN